MGELANFNDESMEDPIIWRDSQGNGLRQSECEDLAYRFRYYYEAQDLERTENYWKFMRWCVDNGKWVIGPMEGADEQRGQ